MIERHDDDGIALIRLSHGKANALDIELLEHLGDVLPYVASQPEIDAVVLTGNGRIFSAGVDLFRVRDGGTDYLERFLPALSRTLETLFLLPVPVVAAVDGHAIAGGLVLALAADRMLVADGPAKLGLTELRVGVPFPGAALEVVRHRLGHADTARLVWEAGLIGAAEARERGWVDALVPAASLIDRARHAAEKLAALPPEAFALTKRQLRAPAIERMRESPDDEVLAQWCAPPAQEAIAAFLDRTVGKSGTSDG